MPGSIEDLLKRVITAEEGYRLHPYLCPAGKVTIGVGRNLTDNGLSESEIELMFANDLRDAREAAASACPSFDELEPMRQVVLVSMAFQLGGKGLKGFSGMLRAVANRDWKTAAAEMLNSKWAKQTPKRVERAVAAMRSGVIRC